MRKWLGKFIYLFSKSKTPSYDRCVWCYSKSKHLDVTPVTDSGRESVYRVYCLKCGTMSFWGLDEDEKPYLRNQLNTGKY